MNLTISHSTALTMDSPVMIIGSIKITYVDMIIYGCFSILIFIAIMLALMKMRHG